MSKAPKESRWPGFWQSTMANVVASIIFLALITVGGLVIATVKRGAGSPNNNPASATARQEDKHLSISDRDFAFSLEKVACGAKKFTIYEAKGEFCILDLKISNHSKNTHSVPVSLWSLYVGDLEYAYVASEGAAFEDLFPGTTAEGQVAFDVPANSSPTELHLQADYGGGVVLGL